MLNVLITGSANGIGKTTAFRLRDAGYKVYGLDKISVDKADKDFAGIELIHANLADKSDIDKALESLKDVKLHGIINNAAEILPNPWETFDFDVWDLTLAANATALLRIVHGLRDNLVSGSSIINLSTGGHDKAAYSNIPYIASKAAIVSLTKSLAVNLGPKGIRVNAIAPGWVTTDSAKPFIPNVTKEITPLGRDADPEDVADVIEFLLSPKSKFISGAVIALDGGYSAVDYSLYALEQSFK
jgi:3-oxoacyl-[acyl-carrier protein] reductase